MAYAGRQHLGAIQGFAQSAGVLGSALGPFPFGLTHDRTGSYYWAFIVSAMVTLLNAVAAWRYMIPPVKDKHGGGAPGGHAGGRRGHSGAFDAEKETTTKSEQRGLLSGSSSGGSSSQSGC